jgi:short-subunit dehydrogenase
VTGASSGIGRAFARALACRGRRIVIIARRRERLEALAGELRDRGASPEVLVADLGEEWSDVADRMRAVDDLGVLVNAAGFGTSVPFAEGDLGKQVAMVRLHVMAAMALCHAVLPGMIARRAGAIINVASIGAFMPAPLNVTYNATKAFLVSFSQSLALELVGEGVHVQALCPGFTRTEFHDSVEYREVDLGRLPSFLWGTPDQVVAASLRELGRRPVVFPRLADRLVARLGRMPLLTRAVVGRLFD